MSNKIYRSKLNKLAKANGIKYYYKYNSFELAEKLGIELPKLRSKQPNDKMCRKLYTVEVTNLDGTTTTYPSITQAAKTLGKFPTQIYIMVAKGISRFL